MNRRTFAITIAALAAPRLATGQTSPLATLYSGPVPRAGRRAIASDWQERFTLLDNAIPTLSPREEDWLRREYDEELRRNNYRITERIINAMNSREYHIREAKSWLEAIQNSLRNILRPNDTRHEILNWSLMAQYMTESRGPHSTYTLHERGMIAARLLPFLPSFPGQQPQGNRETFVSNVVLQGHYIVRNIITPFLWGGLPD